MAANNNDPNKKGSDGNGLGKAQPPKPATPINEEKILAEGREARIAAGKALAVEAKDNPAILDSKKLARIGDDGRAAFIDALRQNLPKAADSIAKKPTSTNRSVDKGKSSAAGTQMKSAAVNSATTKTVRRKPVSPLGAAKGWWHHQSTLSPEAQTLLWGYGCGAGLLTCLIVLFRSIPY